LSRATINDVSALAGVSIKTVSRVINREKYVGDATRAKVEAAIAELHFSPSQAARSLAGRRSFQVALICDNPSPYYVYEMQSGVRARCAVEGVRMIAQPYDREAPNLAAEIAALVDEVKPDGLILTPPVTDNPEIIAALTARSIPFVRVSPGNEGDDSPSVAIDNEAAAFEMTSYLISLGHRRIGFIEGHPGYATSAQRRAGYRRALDEAGVAEDAALIQPGLYSFGSGAAAAEALLALPAPPTAIFASSDDMAAGALAAAHRLGVRVPDDVSIAGFDDTALAEVVWPPLTTIRQPTREMAYAAASLLFEIQPVILHKRLDYALIVRGSTAAVAKG
jgi:LacI family transcriptional regulator